MWGGLQHAVPIAIHLRLVDLESSEHVMMRFPKLVQVCNSYMTHERETWSPLPKTAMRWRWLDINDKDRPKIRSSLPRKLFAVAERIQIKSQSRVLAISSAIELESTSPIGVSS